MKFNPVYHQNVVDNLKRGFKKRYGKELTLTDEKIWDVFEDMSGFTSEDPEDKEFPIFEELKFWQDKVQKGIKDASKLWHFVGI